MYVRRMKLVVRAMKVISLNYFTPVLETTECHMLCNMRHVYPAFAAILTILETPVSPLVNCHQ